MAKLIDLTKENRAERAALVGLITRKQPRAMAEELLDELAELATSARAVVVDRALQKRDAPQPATYVGRGLVEKIKESISEKEIDVVIFDDPLTPAQQRNLEQALNVKVLDRPRLILDIFATRARTTEAMAQVELAQLQYMLPRLTRAWTHLSRQHGGSIGARGPGETQLEIDRRRVRDKISQLKKKLLKIDSQRSLRRKGREELLKISLVGYTNAGKSTLFNKLTKSNVDVANKLFMTLDPTSRIMSTPFPCKVVFTDTVGFVRKLPHELIEAFKSTLEEAVVADLLLHVIDCSSSDFQDKIDQTETVLSQIGATAPAVLVYNKIDLAPDFIAPVSDSRKTALVSAVSGAGLSELRQWLTDSAQEKNFRPKMS